MKTKIYSIEIPRLFLFFGMEVPILLDAESSPCCYFVVYMYLWKRLVGGTRHEDITRTEEVNIDGQGIQLDLLSSIFSLYVYF